MHLHIFRFAKGGLLNTVLVGGLKTANKSQRGLRGGSHFSRFPILSLPLSYGLYASSRRDGSFSTRRARAGIVPVVRRHDKTYVFKTHRFRKDETTTFSCHGRWLVSYRWFRRGEKRLFSLEPCNNRSFCRDETAAFPCGGRRQASYRWFCG